MSRQVTLQPFNSRSATLPTPPLSVIFNHRTAGATTAARGATAATVTATSQQNKAHRVSLHTRSCTKIELFRQEAHFLPLQVQEQNSTPQQSTSYPLAFISMPPCFLQMTFPF